MRSRLCGWYLGVPGGAARVAGRCGSSVSVGCQPVADNPTTATPRLCPAVSPLPAVGRVRSVGSGPTGGARDVGKGWASGSSRRRTGLTGRTVGQATRRATKRQGSRQTPAERGEGCAADSSHPVGPNGRSNPWAGHGTLRPRTADRRASNSSSSAPGRPSNRVVDNASGTGQALSTG
jgi:hypothetical protein